MRLLTLHIFFTVTVLSLVATHAQNKTQLDIWPPVMGLGITVFYSVPHGIETALIKGWNEMRAMAEIGQHINNFHYSNKITLTTSVKENKPKNCEKRYERREVVLKEKEDWIKPTKHVPIVCLYKKYNKGPENDKISNAHDGFVEDFELGNIE